MNLTCKRANKIEHDLHWAGYAQTVRPKEMNSKGNKVLLISKTGYSPDKNHILLNLIAEPIALFCAFGKDCQTTSHPDETIEDVIEFARIFSVDKDEGIRILEV